MSIINIVPGMRLFDYDIGQSSMLRVYKIVNKSKMYASEDDDRIIVIDNNNRKKTVKAKDIKNYTLLKPKALATFSVVKINGIADVIVTIHSNNNSLEIICRQSCVDIIDTLSIMRNNDSVNKASIGMSITKKIAKELELAKCMDGDPFTEYLKCDKFVSKNISYVYLDDTLNDIVKYCGAKKRFDKVMKNMYFYYDKNFKDTDLINTASTSLYNLLYKTDFMIDLHDVMNIIDIPFSIKNKETTPIDALKDIITQISGNHPSKIVIYPFDYKIGLTEIKMEYLLMMKDSVKHKNGDSNLYIVGYTIDNDNVHYFSNKKNVDDAFKKLGFK